VTDPICLEPDYSPCRYNGTCPATRRKQQSDAGLRGDACWAFQQITEKLAKLALPKEEVA
jgi:hypothetical protein